jgi:hypothetical protein
MVSAPPDSVAAANDGVAAASNLTAIGVEALVAEAIVGAIVVCTIGAAVCTRPMWHRRIAVVPCHVTVSDHIASLAAIFTSTISTPATITIVVIQISHQILIPLGVGPVDAFLELSKIRHDRNIRVRLRQRSADGPSGLPVSSQPCEAKKARELTRNSF